MSNLRILSWLLLLTAIAGPAAWAYFEMANFAESRPGPGCGLPILGILAVAVLVSGLLSITAAIVGWLAWRRIPRPRPIRRTIEILVLAAPVVVCVVLIVTVLIL